MSGDGWAVLVREIALVVRAAVRTWAGTLRLCLVIVTAGGMLALVLRA